MPDLSHLWQRFLLATALVFGLLLGVAATVFGYSNTRPVNVGWSVLHIDGVPLWTVAIFPLAIVLVAGTIYHWFNSLHHFTEHMRHRRRVHELEAELTSLRAHMDHLLEMPDHSSSATAPKHVVTTPVPLEPPIAQAALPEPASSNGETKPPKRSASRKRVALPAASETEPETAVPAHATDDAAKPDAAKEAAAETA